MRAQFHENRHSSAGQPEDPQVPTYDFPDQLNYHQTVVRNDSAMQRTG